MKEKDSAVNRPTNRRSLDGSSLPRVRAVSRAVSILRAFSPEQPYLALSEIVRKTGLDAGTARRLLVTLRDEGLVHQDLSTGKYAGSVGLIKLSAAVPENLSLKGLVEDRLVRLAEETATTVYLSVVSGDAAMCIARYHGAHAIEVRWWAVGETMPLNCGAGPRVLFAHLDPAHQRRLLEGSLEALTENSTVDAGQLRAELSEIRETGYATARDDVALGLSAIAVPLSNDAGDTIAAVSLGGLTPQIIGKREPALVATLQEAAADMRKAVQGLR